MSNSKNLLLVPFDPVHDVGIRLVGQKLRQAGHRVALLPPDLPPHEVVKQAQQDNYDFILIGRTMGYGVEQILGRLIDQLEASGGRSKAKLVLGGKAVTPELAAELGFDAGFAPTTPIEEIIAYVEGKPLDADSGILHRHKRDITRRYSYEWKHPEIGRLLDTLAEATLAWAENKISPGIERAELRRAMLEQPDNKAKYLGDYLRLCDDSIAKHYRENIPVGRTRLLSEAEVKILDTLKRRAPRQRLQHCDKHPLCVFFVGSGCPVMDIAHTMVADGWGVDGVILVDPSWSARVEGMMQGYVAQEEDGTVVTGENMALMKKHFNPDLYFQLRLHRGLNTAECAVYGAHYGTDFGKINPCYGSLHGGTDPERLVADAIYAMRTAARAGFPFDMPGNDELSGTPPEETFAGMLTTAALGMKLGARPILKPLLCFSPYAMLHGQMDSNYIDYNYGKIKALQSILDAPVWCGEPVGFNTHEDDRCQSATTTALHAMLASAVGAEALTFASTDESYSRGPIVMASRIDTFKSIQTAFRFFGDATLQPRPKAGEYRDRIIEGIHKALKSAARAGDFVKGLYEGCYGTAEVGAKPGRAGRKTVRLTSG